MHLRAALLRLEGSDALLVAANEIEMNQLNCAVGSRCRGGRFFGNSASVITQFRIHRCHPPMAAPAEGPNTSRRSDSGAIALPSPLTH